MTGIFLAPPPVAPSSQSFDDRFGNQLDPKAWVALTRPSSQEQCYLGTNASVGVSGLEIVTLRTTDLPASCRAKGFSSARVQSKASYLYGELKVVAKLPTGKGIWPAIWMRTVDGTPMSGEIDLLEGYGSYADRVQGTVHGWIANHHVGFRCGIAFMGALDKVFAERASCQARNIRAASSVSAFHTYSFVWTPDRIAWFLDNVKFFETTEFVPHTPMMIVLETHVGGVFDGPSTAATPAASRMIVKSISFTPLSR